MDENFVSVPYHTVERYLATVFDREKDSRTDADIRAIIRRAYANADVPKKLPPDFHCLTEFLDPVSNASFGFYYAVICKDAEKGINVIKTILPLEFRR